MLPNWKQVYSAHRKQVFRDKLRFAAIEAGAWVILGLFLLAIVYFADKGMR